MVYDLMVLGGGPAGYTAALRAAQNGLSTLLIEKDKLGGVCLNEGCIPTKALLYAAGVYRSAVHAADYGVQVDNVSYDPAAAAAHKQRVIDRLVSGIGASVKAAGVTVFHGCGRIVGRCAEGWTVDADGERFNSTRLLVATGSQPILPSILGLDAAIKSGFALTSRELLALQTVPERLIVVGGGAIGLEFAHYYCSIGSSVTVIEMLDHVAGGADRALSTLLLQNLEKQGVTFHLNTRVTGFREGYVDCGSNDGSVFTLEADRVLLCLGRKPAPDMAGLARLGVLCDRGAIVCDGQMRTNLPDLYVAGDLNGRSMLAHTAYREAEVAINTMLSKYDRMDYRFIPSVIYVKPEFACAGESEQSAADKGLAVSVATLPMTFSGRFLAENTSANGMCKLIVQRDNGRLIGAHALGSYASEFIVAASAMMQLDVTLEQLRRIVFPHPTVAEILRECAFQIQQ